MRRENEKRCNMFYERRYIVYVGTVLMMVLGFPGAVADAEEIYHWPLNLPRDLSSSFAEYRTGRFHAGIDLRTGGVIGRPVFAAEDGYVSRVRCSPWGYGKAVYLQLRDGNIAVYAHLDDYYDELRDYVRAAQHAARSYTVDLYPEPGRFPVRRGRQIAVSGRTGVGPPHLHYELRDSANRPFNPRLIGIQWPDATRPEVRGLVAIPDGPGSTVNGSLSPVTLEISNLGSGQYRSAPVSASGRIGFGVDVIDPGNDGLRLGIHVLRLLHGEQEIFRVQHDYLSYDDIHHGAVSYHPFLSDIGRFLLLWRWPDNTTALYSQSSGDGWFNVPDGGVELLIEAVDFMGNGARVIVPVVPETTYAATRQEPHLDRGHNDAPDGNVSVACQGLYLTITAQFHTDTVQAPVLLVESGLDILSVPFLRESANAWQAAFAPPGTGSYTLRTAHPRMAANEKTVHVLARGAPERTLSFDELQITVKPASPFGMLYVHASAETSPRSHAIPLRGRAWRIWPEESPIDAQVEVSLPIPDSSEQPARTGLYRATGRGWRHVGGRRAGNRLTAGVRNFGTYAVMEDNQPPVIAAISPPDDYQAQTQRPIIRATITDVGSGISDFSITANGRWLLAEYDPDEDRLEWERDRPLDSGANEIVYQVTDNAGNVTTARRTVFIP